MIAYDSFFCRKDIGKPYGSGMEHIGDYMSIIDMVCRVVIDYRKNAAGGTVKNNLKGIVVTDDEAEAIFTGAAGIPGADRIDIAESRAILKALRHIAGREDSSGREGVFLPIQHVSKVFCLTAFEKFCMVMSLIAEVDRKYEKVYGYLHDSAGEKLPTVGLAAAVYALFTGAAGRPEFLMPSQFFFRYVLEGKQGNDSLSRLSRPMRLNEKIYEFLIGKGFENSPEETYMKVEFPAGQRELITDGGIQERIRSVIKGLSEGRETDKTAICLYGPQGTGKRLQVRHTALYLDMPLVWVDCAELRKNFKKLDECIKNIVRSAILYQGLLCLNNFDALIPSGEEEEQEYAAEDVLNRLADNADVLFVLSAREWRHGAGSIPYRVVGIPLEVPDDSVRLDIWRKLSQNIEFAPDIDLAELSNKFGYTTGMIEKAISEASFEAAVSSGGVVDKDTLYRASIRQSVHRLEKKAAKLKPAFTWDDLILPDDQKRALMDACNHIKYKHIVLGQWGFDRKLPYGRGLGILFYGPPGTGKTMGAQVLANELKLEMFRIDLSQTVSKYIGETEKNLKEIFDEAARTSAILFFDEADSLFGKRGEVKDSHDRYANLETSYLLQKMEEYEGITILATNLLQNFDEAYRRRFKFLINFPMPDAKTRRIMWKAIFPEALPMDEDVDLDFLAEQFELSGSNIKNIAVAASFLAAGEGTELKMKHLVRALKNELTKAGKVVVKQDLGGYGDLL